MWRPIISPYRAAAHSQPLNRHSLPSTTPQPLSLSLCRCIHICLLAVGERAHDLPLWGILGTWPRSSVRSIVLLQRRVTLLEKILADIFDFLTTISPLINGRICFWGNGSEGERQRVRERKGNGESERERCPCKYTSANPARQTRGGAERERGFDFDLRWEGACVSSTFALSHQLSISTLHLPLKCLAYM